MGARFNAYVPRMEQVTLSNVNSPVPEELCHLVGQSYEEGIT